MPAISGFDTGRAKTALPVSLAVEPPPPAPALAIERARLQAPVETSMRFVKVVTREGEAATAVAGAVVIKGVAIADGHDAAKCLVGGV